MNFFITTDLCSESKQDASYTGYSYKKQRKTCGIFGELSHGQNRFVGRIRISIFKNVS